MNLSSHILVRMGLDKSQFDAGMRNIKNEIKGFKDLFKMGGAVGMIGVVISGFQAIAESGATAAAKFSLAWSDRFRAMSSAITETKNGLSVAIATALYWATIVPVVLERFKAALYSGSGFMGALGVAFDTGAEERQKRVIAAQEKYNRAARESRRESMGTQEKLDASLAELAILEKQLEVTKDQAERLEKSTEMEEKTLEVLRLQKTLKDEIAKAQKDSDQKAKESARETMELEKERTRNLWDAVDAMRNMESAHKGERDAMAGLGTAIEDRSGLTLEDYINTQPVNKKTFDNRRKAMDIRALEQRSKWARWFGDEEWANSDTLAALNLRKSLPGLTSSERDPMQSIRDSVADSQEHLRQLLDDERSGRFNVQIKNTP